MIDSKKVTLPDPAFVIEYDNKLYMTLGVLEYDENHSGGLDDNQKETIKKLKEQLDKGSRARAAPVADWYTYAGGITK